MVLSGYTVDAYKADSVSKSFIYFYIADSVPEPKEYDSTLFNYKPQVIARAETNGIFLAQNLKPVPYRVYAFQDTNDNQMYEPSIDKVGFLDSLINPALMPDFSVWYDSLRHYVTADPQVFMRMFTDVAFKRQTLQQSERPARHKAMLYFGAAHPEVTGLRFDSIPAERVIWGSPDRGARYGGPVVRRALGLASRYDQGRDHLFQTRYGQQVAGGDRNR